MISLSLGFEKNDAEVEKSITAVNNDVLIFAAASNRGMSFKHPVYPARDDRVICVHSARSNGASSDDNPPAEGGKDLMTLGQDVPSAWPHKLQISHSSGSQKRSSGSSVATAVLASTAGLLLELLRQEPDNLQMRWAAAQMKKTSAMKLILRDMSQENNHRRYVEPFQYLHGSQEDTELGPYSRRNRLQMHIFNELLEIYQFGDPDQMIGGDASKGLLMSSIDESRQKMHRIYTLARVFGTCILQAEWREDDLKALRDSLPDGFMAASIKESFPVQLEGGKPLLKSRPATGKYWDHLTTTGLAYYASVRARIVQEFAALPLSLRTFIHTIPGLREQG